MISTVSLSGYARLQARTPLLPRTIGSATATYGAHGVLRIPRSGTPAAGPQVVYSPPFTAASTCDRRQTS